MEGCDGDEGCNERLSFKIRKDKIRKEEIRKDRVRKDRVRKDRVRKDRVRKDRIRKDAVRKAKRCEICEEWIAFEFSWAEEMVGRGEDGIDVSRGGIVQQRCADDRARVGVEEGLAQGAGVWNANADVLHESGREESAGRPSARAGTSQGVVARSGGSGEQEGVALAGFSGFAGAERGGGGRDSRRAWESLQVAEGF